MTSKKDTPFPLSVLRTLSQKLNRLRKRTTTLGQVLPPYLLIGVLWYINGEQQDRERAEDKIEDQVTSAVLKLEADNDAYTGALAIRKDCVDDVVGREKTRENWHSLYDFIESLGPDAVYYANSLRVEFDIENPPKTVEEECKNFPEPMKPEIPRILIERGIVNE